MQNNLEYYRRREGLTQAELSQRTGIPECSISRVEKGSTDFKGQLWKIIARALDCTIDELLGVREF